MLVEAFGLGNVAILNNVCLLPLYPGLLAFLAGNATQTRRVRMGLLGGLVLAGVLTMMMGVALVLNLVNSTVGDILPYLLPALYGFVIVLGGLMLAGYNPWARLQTVQAPMLKNTYGTAYVYGLLLGPMTLPCIGPVIITAFALGANSARSLVDGLLYFLAFGLGFGWPLVVLPLIAAGVQRKFVTTLTRRHTLLTRVSGVLLVGIGIIGFVTEVIPSLGVDEKPIETRWLAAETLTDHSEPVNALTFSGDRLLSAGGTGNSGLVSGGTDFAVRLWGDSTPLARWEGIPNSTESLSAVGRYAATGGWDNIIRVWDVNTGSVLNELKGHPTRIESLAFNPQNDSQLASGSQDGIIFVWDVESGERMLEFQHPRFTALAWNGTTLATASVDPAIRLWDNTGGSIGTLEGHTDRVNALDFHGGLLASGSADGTVRVWENQTEKYVLQDGQNSAVNAVAFSPDGKRLAAGMADHTVIVWNMDTGRRMITLRGLTAPVLSVAFSEATLAAASQDGTIQLWEVPPQ